MTWDNSGNLVFAEAGGFRVRRLSGTSGSFITIAGSGTNGFSGDGGAATSAAMGNPSSVAIDRSGNMYISEYTQVLSFTPES
jgi:hypothetical protein